MSDEIYLLRIIQALMQRHKSAYLWADATLQVRYASSNASTLLDFHHPVGHSLPEICQELIGVEDILKKIAHRQHPRLTIEHINRETLQGEMRYFSISIFPPQESHPPGLVVLLEDTTSLGYLIQELNQSRNTLRLTQWQLEEANRFKSTSLAIASHEVRGRLGTVLGYLDLLATDENLSTDGQEMLDIIRWEIHSLNMLLHQLISIDQIERQQLIIHQEPVDLSALVKHLWKIYMLPASGQYQTSLEVPETPFFVLGDKNRLHQVFCNLVSNAIKYTPEGGHIRIGLEATDEDVTLWVHNTGSGISTEDQKRLFQPYFRTRDQQRLRQQGSGLGLYISQELVQAHQGQISVESQENDYTIFRVTLPRYYPK